MTLFRKIAFVVLLLTALVLGIAGYLSLRSIKEPSTDVLAYMPDSCLIYMEVPSLHELNVKWNEQSLMALKWKASGGVSECSHSIKQLDSLLQHTETFKELLGALPLSVAVYADLNQLHWLAVMKLGELRHQKTLETLLNDGSAETIPLKKMGVSYLLRDGMLLLSDTKTLLERSSGKGLKLSTNKELKEMLQGVSSADAFRFFVSQSFQNKPGNKQVFHIPSYLNTECYAAGVKIQPNEIVLNGNIVLRKDQGSVFWQNQNAVELKYAQYLPAGTDVFRTYAVSDPEKFKDSIQTNNELFQFWKLQEKKALYPIYKDFYLNLYNSFSVFEWQEKQSFCFMVKDTVLFDDVCNTLFKKDSAGTSYLISESDFMKKAFFNTFDAASGALVRRGQTVYVAVESNVLNAMILQMKTSGTLEQNESFTSYASEHINPKANFVYYASPQHHPREIKKWLDYNQQNETAYLENITDASLVLSKQGNMFKFRAQINYRQTSSEGQPGLLWQFALDTSSFQKPYIFTNHVTGEHELVLQDASNSLYLVNNRGTLLWKKTLEEPVRSDIYEVDIFRNGKRQLFFNTDHYLYMIDRNGKDVQGYPVKLPAMASNAVSLIDYDGDGDYRVFIACENKSIYNFNLYGVKSEGYTPYRTEHAVKLPVKFARVGASDYLLTIDETGEIHAFSRKGDARIGFKNKAVEACTDFKLIATNSIFNSYLLYVDERNSLINKVSFADKKEIVKLTDDIHNSKILFENLNDDFTPDFVSLSSNGTKGYDVNGNFLFDHTGIHQADDFSYSSFSGKRTAVIYSSAQGKADVLKGFSGKSMNIESTALPLVFPLYKDERVYLLAVSGNKLKCYLLK